ncbi:MAG: DUF3798 domain-containing protein, partial [Lachnospiraceae bacterium]|nr:DUF3798 domain-containing protein [Lachnospiraceae bacterium]
MKKKILSILLGTAMVVSLAACGNSGSAKIESAATEAASAAESVAESVEEKAEEVVSEAAEAAESVEEKAEEAVAEVSEGAEDFHIGIVTGSVSQSEDDRRGAEAFQAKYGEDVVKLAIYPDNFTEELETTIQTIVNLSDDPLMKAIIV